MCHILELVRFRHVQYVHTVADRVSTLENFERLSSRTLEKRFQLTFIVNVIDDHDRNRCGRDANSRRWDCKNNPATDARFSTASSTSISAELRRSTLVRFFLAKRCPRWNMQSIFVVKGALSRDTPKRKFALIIHDGNSLTVPSPRTVHVQGIYFSTRERIHRALIALALPSLPYFFDRSRIQFSWPNIVFFA